MTAFSESHNPFPGLHSFKPEQAQLFFGRDEQIRDLLERLKQSRFLPIVGMSGSGKSSLVRAGLIPALTGSYVDTETSRWRIVVLRPGRNPLRELASALCREFTVRECDDVLQTLHGSSAGLARIAQQQLGRKEKLLILVDQFEELFRYREDGTSTNETDDDAAFVKLLLAAAGESKHPLPGLDRLQVYVVTTMRSDFLGECSRFRGLPEALNQSHYLIPRLTRVQKREVIEGPLRVTGDMIEPALVQRLLNDLSDNPDQLPTLQHALMRTWEQSAEARTQGEPITVVDYEAVGGMNEALNLDADRVHQSLSSYDAAITRRLFQRLVAPDGETRSPTPLSELVAVTAVEEDAVKLVISVFHQRGFLTISHDQDPIIDITHESLIRGWRKLTTWVQEEAQSAMFYRRLTDTAALYAKAEASLLVDPQLQLTLNWREETKPNEAWAARYDSRFTQAMVFLEQCRQEHYKRMKQQRRSERQRLTVRVLGPLLLIAVCASIFAAIQWKRAVVERDRSNRLLYDSNIYFASSAVASGQFTLARERLNELLKPGLRDLRGFEWFYLWRTVHANETTLSGHSGAVLSVAFSSDGKTQASASTDKTVKLWDRVGRKEMATLSGHSDDVLSLAFSPDGKTLASGSADGTVKLWDVAARREVVTFSGHYSFVTSIAFLPDGKTLVSASTDNTVKLWDISTRKEVDTPQSYANFVTLVALSSDGKLVASCGYDKTVKLWDVAAHREVATFSSHSDYVRAVAFSFDGKILASGSDDKTVKLWDIAARKELATLSGHPDAIMSVAFSPDGRTLASASVDKTVKLWDMAVRKQVATLSGHSGAVLSVAFSHDGKTVASASADKTVRVWDIGAVTLPSHSDAVWSVAFSPDGKTLASASADHTVKLWDTTTRKELATLSVHSKSVSSIAFSPDGKTRSSTSEDKSVGSSIAFSPDGKILGSTSEDRTVKLWDTTTRKELATFSGHSHSIAFSPDGKTLASAGEDHIVKLWDIAARKQVATLVGHTDSVWSVTFSPDGKTLASASGDKTIKLWDTIERKELATLASGNSDFFRSVAFSPDGKLLASANADNTVHLWDAATRKQLDILLGHSNSVWSVAFSPDGKTLASTSADRTVKLWDIAARKELATLLNHTDSVWSVTFSPDGKMLASASTDKTVRLWLAATDQEVEQWHRRSN